MATEYKKVHDPKREILTFYMCMVCKSMKFYMFVCSASVAQFVSIPIWKALFNKFSFNHQLLSRG